MRTLHNHQRYSPEKIAPPQRRSRMTECLHVHIVTHVARARPPATRHSLPLHGSCYLLTCCSLCCSTRLHAHRLRCSHSVCKTKVAAAICQNDKSTFWSPQGPTEYDVPRMPIGDRFWADVCAPAQRDLAERHGLLFPSAEGACLPATVNTPRPGAKRRKQVSSLHRDRQPFCPMPVNACVARPVDRKERKWNHEAQSAVQTEWDKLRALPGGGAWDESQPRDLNKLLREAKAQGRTLH